MLPGLFFGPTSPKEPSRIPAMFANIRVLLLTCASLLIPIASFSEPVPFKRAIELAIRNSSTMGAASADVSRLQAVYLETRDAYIPQVYFGSGLAYSFGFPLGEPSIFKVSSTSLLLNYAQREFIKAARSDIKAATATREDKKNQVILETALSYSELDKSQASISILQQQEAKRGRSQFPTPSRSRREADCPNGVP